MTNNNSKLFSEATTVKEKIIAVLLDSTKVLGSIKLPHESNEFNVRIRDGQVSSSIEIRNKRESGTQNALIASMEVMEDTSIKSVVEFLESHDIKLSENSSRAKLFMESLIKNRIMYEDNTKTDDPKVRDNINKYIVELKKELASVIDKLSLV